MILNKLHPEELIMRSLMVDIMRQIPLHMVIQKVQENKLPGNYLQEFEEEDKDGEKRTVFSLDYEWLFFEATNHQLEVLVNMLLPKDMDKQVQQQAEKSTRKSGKVVSITGGK